MSTDDTPPYIVRFVIQKLECPALVTGMMYCIHWKRGSFRGTTPPMACDSGVVNFSSMPEAHAVLHFKPNVGGAKGSGKFQHKYITFSIEELSRGKREVGLVEFDVANCLRGSERTAQVVKHSDFRMAGFGASVEVLVTLYPEGETRPAVSQLAPRAVPAAAVATAAIASPRISGVGPVASVGRTKKLTRDEAMTLLLSVEGLLDQRGAAGAENHQYAAEDEAALSAQVREIEEKIAVLRNKLNARRIVAQAALQVATSETCTYVDAQFRALEDTPSGQTFVSDVKGFFESARGTTSQTRTRDPADLQRCIATAQQELRQLEQDQDRLGQLQLRRDVSDDLVRLLGATHAKQQELAKLHEQLAASSAAAASSGQTNSFEAHKRAALEELDSLAAKRDALEAYNKESRRVYAARIEEWANRKYAAMRELDRADKANKLRDDEERKAKQQVQLQQQILDLFGEVQAPAAVAEPTAQQLLSAPQPSPPASHTQSVVAPPQSTLFDDLYNNVPQTSDFAPSTIQQSRQPESALAAPRAATQEPVEYRFAPPAEAENSARTLPATHAAADPFADLHSNMFGADAPPSNSDRLPSQASLAAAQSQPPTYHFGEEQGKTAAVAIKEATQTLRSELRRTYAFEGGDDTLQAERSLESTRQNGGADFSSAPSASATYDFGTVVDSRSLPPQLEVRQSLEAQRQASNDSFWGSPPHAAATQQPPPVTITAPYSFDAASAQQDSGAYTSTNIFASFGES